LPAFSAAVGDAIETKEHNVIVVIINPSAVSSGSNGWIKAALVRRSSRSS